VIVRSLLSASDAPWQTRDLKEIHSRCGKNHFRKMAAVMKNFWSRVEFIFKRINILVYQGGRIALPVLSALHHYRYLELPLILMIFYSY